MAIGAITCGSYLLTGNNPQKAYAASRLKNLQTLIDRSKQGDILTPPPGIYQGPVTINKAITLDGQNKVSIDAGGKGSVIYLKTNGAVLKNLYLTNTGAQHNDIDAGIQVRGDFNVIKNNTITESLFGIDLQQSSNNVIRNNMISSKSDATLGIRGDAIRLWYSRNNRIEKNKIRNSRDIVVWYSADNVIANNDVAGGRYGLHFMYSKYNLVENNSFYKNAVGIFLMYSDSVVIRGNRVVQALGAAGVGIGFKEASNCDIHDNDILYNSTGLYLDLSPFQPDTTNRIYRNKIAYNDLGVAFLNDWPGNHFKDNIFSSNSHHVSVSSFAGATHNIWEGNYWDDYQGFDGDDNKIGDSPYRPKVYADRLWMDVKPAAFFRGAPVLSMLDFLERLAPFTTPLLMLEDKKPRVSRIFKPFTNAASDKSNGNAGQTLKTFGGATNANTKSGTSMKRLDPFNIDAVK
ncbi:MAG: nitrous oxide reductase family maturation protein NosD [bacterium]|nr:nitrous oxide reductase family maturation protein NosD [bacterium]